MDFRRARSQEQIQDRINEIVSITIELYKKLGYERLTYSEISKHTDFTRPNLYKYFKTKEEILLYAIRDEFEKMVENLEIAFEITKSYTPKDISIVWSETVCKHDTLLDIYSILYSILEKKVSVEALAKFKKDMIPMQMPLISLCQRLIPNADIGKIENFIFYQMTIAFGLYSATKLNELQSQAIILSGMAYTPPDFQQTYQLWLYQGLKDLRE